MQDCENCCEGGLEFGNCHSEVELKFENCCYRRIPERQIGKNFAGSLGGN